MDMKNHYKVGFKIQKNRLLWWLVILLTILLVVAIGMFVFLSLNAKYDFACVLGCDPKAIEAGAQTSVTGSTSFGTTAATQSSPKTSDHGIETTENCVKPMQEQFLSTENTTVIKIDSDTIIRSRRPIIHSTTPPTSARTSSVIRNVNTERAKSRLHTESTTAHLVTQLVDKVNDLRTTNKPFDPNQYINITGKVSFEGKTPRRFSRNSRLIVEFEETFIADAPTVVLAKTIVGLKKYRRGRPLFYTIICKRPQFESPSYSVSALLNVGWKPTRKNKRIRKGDFFSDTFFWVNIKRGKAIYERNIQLVKY